jgi:hypothetical protein
MTNPQLDAKLSEIQSLLSRSMFYQAAKVHPDHIWAVIVEAEEKIEALRLSLGVGDWQR